MDDMMIAFHQNGAFFIDCLRNSFYRSNLFPIYNLGLTASDEGFEFDDETSDDIQLVSEFNQK